MLLGASATPEVIDRMNAKFGLDKPVPVQYGYWLFNAVQGDLGTSLRSHNSVVSEIFRRSQVTVELTLLATLFSIIVGVPAGIFAARHRGSHWQ